MIGVLAALLNLLLVPAPRGSCPGAVTARGERPAAIVPAHLAESRMLPGNAEH